MPQSAGTQDYSTISFAWNVAASLIAYLVTVAAGQFLSRRRTIAGHFPAIPVIQVAALFGIVLALSLLAFRSPPGTSFSLALLSSLGITLTHIWLLSNKVRRLSMLADILGATDWVPSSQPLETVGEYLGMVRKNFRFLGMGFHKFTSYQQTDGKPDLSAVVRICDGVAPTEKIQVMMMAPFAEQVSQYEQKRKATDQTTTAEKILASMRSIEKLRESGYHNIEARFYPNSAKAIANFRMFFVDNNRLFLSYYKYRDEGYTVPQISIEQDGDNNFFRPFSELFRYFWENGEPADYYRLAYPLSSDDVRYGTKTQALLEYIPLSIGPFLPRVQLRDSRVALAAIAGKDSVAAILRILETRQFNVVVPVIINVPTEYGRPGVRLDTVRLLRQYSEQRYGDLGSVVSAALVVNDTGLWGKINGGSTLLDLQTVYGSYSPCVGCHLYIHALRCRLARDLGIGTVISGDREKHDGTVKLNQLGDVLTVFERFAQKEYGVRLHLPLKAVADDREIQDILRQADMPRISDLTCHFGGSGSLNSMTPDQVQKWVKYLDQDAIPKFVKEVGR